MKIGIITNPPRTNYGGILQAYALQRVLREMGCDVWTIPSYTKENDRLSRKLLRLLKLIYLRCFRGQSVEVRMNIEPSEKIMEMVTLHTQRFIDANIRFTKPVNRENPWSTLKEYKFECYVVGSDQIWLPKYVPFSFLSFLPDNDEAKRIAYAVSTGVDEWMINSQMTAICRKLACKFNAISVREDSLVKLCREKLGINPIHILDPTMLLRKDDYMKLVSSPSDNRRKLMSYVLDKSLEKREFIERVCCEMSLEENSIMPQKDYMRINSQNAHTAVFPSVEEWLSGFANSEFVITDSFHGTVFAILFNKPFIVLGNQRRGMARFESLLSKFGLSDRLIYSFQEFNIDIITSNIDFNKVEEILDIERLKALNFIKNNITNGAVS